MKIIVSAVAYLATLSAVAAADGWWKPTPGTSYQIQLSGTLDLTPKVQMFDLDLFDTPAATIASLKAMGVKVICYFSAGTYEDWRDDKGKFTKDMYGKGLPEWQGESWLDTRNAKVREILAARMQLAQQKGCDGVDPDNVDAAYNDSGFPLTSATQLDFNRFLAATAHSLNLSVGLKNNLDLVAKLAPDFDFAVNEQCAEYNECETLQPFIKLNKPVFGIEYKGTKATVCKKANELNMDTLFKDLALKNERYSCRESLGATPTMAPPTTTAPTPATPTTTMPKTPKPTKVAPSTPTTTTPTVPAATTTAPTTSAPTAPTTPTVGSWWKPTPGTSYQIQLSGTLDLTPKVQMFDLDLFDTPAATIASLKAKGVKVICYFSAGTYEDWREDKGKFTSDMYGKGLPEWQGESWLDTRNAKVREILAARMQLAQQKGCDGVDPDNVDAAYNDSGFPLTSATQLDFNRFLAATAHSLNLSVGLKNNLDLVAKLAPDFDFAVNEQCAEYNECETLQPFIKLNKPVFGIEYKGTKATVCKKANELNMDTLFKDLALKNERYSCREN